MNTITELNPRRLALTEAGVSAWLDRVEAEEDPADAVRSLTARITRILQEG